ncbi:MAG: insulinase family protein [Candidatus Wallbacteria bacterium]
MQKLPIIIPEYYKLSNGFSICLCGNFPYKSSQISVLFLSKCGLYSETPEKAGITHALEHMLFKGTKKHSNFEFMAEINSLGSSVDAFTAADSMCIELMSPADNFEKSFSLFSDLILNPVFPEKEVELEKKVVINEILFYEDDPEDLLTLRLESECFKGTCYQNPILGTRNSVNSLTREEFQKYHKDYFTPENCMMTVIGDFNEPEMAGFIEKFFGEKKWKRSKTGPKYFNLTNINDKPTHSVIKRLDKFSQNYLGFSFVLPPSIAGIDSSAMILPYVFSSLKSSPLGFLLREKNNIVNAFSADLIFKQGAWMMSLIASCEPRYMNKVKNIILNFIKRASSLVSRELFESARNLILLDYFQEIETAKNYCNELTTFNHIIGETSYNKSIENLLKISYEDFLDYLSKYVEPAVLHFVEIISKEVNSFKHNAEYIKLKNPDLGKANAANFGYENSFYKLKKYNPKLSADVSCNTDNPARPIISTIDTSLLYSTLNMWIEGGVIASQIPGDAYIFSELFGKKTHLLSSYDNFIKNDYLGIYYDCNIFLDYVLIEAVCPGKFTGDKIKRLDEFLNDFDFTGDMLKKAKQVVKRSVAGVYDDVFEYPFWNFIKILFEGKCYSKSIFGNEKFLSEINAENVINYYNNLKNSSSRYCISYSAAVNSAEIIKNNLSYINLSSRRPLDINPNMQGGKLINGCSNIFNKFDKNAFLNSGIGGKTIEIKSRQQQATVLIGGYAPEIANGDSLAFSIANYILADYTGKRLWDLRESHGLCYNIFSEYIPLAYSGVFFCYANTDINKLGTVAEKICCELDKYCADGPTEKEVAEAKMQLIKKMELGLNSSASLSKAAGSSIFYGKTLSEFLEYKKRIESVEVNKINAVIRKYMSPKKLLTLRVLTS